MNKEFKGRLLNQRYELLSYLGEDETTDVWKALDTVLARTVAVKILKSEHAQQQHIVETFHAVSIAAARLSHPGIISIFDTGCDHGYNYVVLEWLDGMTLREALLLRENEHADNFLYYEVARFSRKVAAALEHAHRSGMLHGNIQPSKIFITNDGDVKVTDFGLCTDPLQALFVAPEVLEGNIPSVQSDLYALGLTMYQALTGINPVAEIRSQSSVTVKLQPPNKYVKDLPANFNNLVTSMINRDPNYRPLDADDVSSILRPFEWKPSTAVEQMEEEVVKPSFLSEMSWVIPVVVLFSISGFLMWKSIHTSGFPSVSTSTPVVTQPPSVEVFEGGQTFEDAKIVEILPFDPQGDKAEMNSLLDNLLSEDPSKLWQTELYHNEYFGGLKTGVGVILDLGEKLHIQNIVLTTPEGGFHVDIAADNKIGKTLDDWHFISIDNTLKTGQNTLHVTPIEAARYVLIWIKGPLPPSGDMFRMQLNSVSVTYQRSK